MTPTRRTRKVAAAKEQIAAAPDLAALETALANAVEVAGSGRRRLPPRRWPSRSATAPAPAKVAKEVPVKVAKPTVDTSGLSDLVTLVRNLEADLAAAIQKRNQTMSDLYATGNISYAKIAEVVGRAPWPPAPR